MLRVWCANMTCLADLGLVRCDEMARFGRGWIRAVVKIIGIGGIIRHLDALICSQVEF